MDRQKVQRIIGRACQEWRRKQGYTQLDVALQLEMSPENVSAFERGLNDSSFILTWYLLNGFDPLESEDVWLKLKTC